MAWRGARRVFLSSVAFAAFGGSAIAACDGGGAVDAPADASDEVPFIDARGPVNLPIVSVEDASAAQTVGDASGVLADTTPPGSVADLVAVADTHASVTLSWSAAPDEADAGTVAAYEVRYATTPLATVSAFLAGTVVAPPAPLFAGSPQSVTVSGLSPATEYYFAVRARDAAGNAGLPSAVVVTTKARAVLVVSEVAPNSTEAHGHDFVELLTVTAGSTAGLEVRHSAGANPSALLHRLAPLDVAVGDRIVVHAAGLPAPAGFVQEDAAKSKAASIEPSAGAEAYDVYAPAETLVASGGVVAVLDGASYQDAVAYSDRNTVDVSATTMSAFALAHSAGAWTFSTPPVDAADDCATLLDTANAHASASVPACGGYPGFRAPGTSLQRRGATDTNSRADFFVAPHTRGRQNAPYCPPEGAELALTEVNPIANLVELTVTKGGSLRGHSVRRDPRASTPLGTLLGSLPAICATAGDVIVIHLDAPEGALSETAAKDERAAAMHPQNYDDAWDVAQSSSASSLPYATSVVIAVRNPRGVYVDGAAFSSQTVTPPEGGTFHQSLGYLQALGLWLPSECAGVPCTNTTTPAARAIAASWNGVGTLASDASCRRASPTSSPEAPSWSVGAASFGH